MPKETKDAIESEIIRILHAHHYECGCVPATEELLAVAKKAYELGRNARD